MDAVLDAILEQDRSWVIESHYWRARALDALERPVGVLCELPAQTVFVKIQGPSDEVRAHVGEFRGFCASLGLQ